MDTPRFCIDCRHFQKDPDCTTEEAAIRRGVCLKQVITEYDLVSGAKKAEYYTASVQRAPETSVHSCGRMGAWFEPKAPGNIIDKTINNLREGLKQ
jgi:hypothetical protein